MIAIDLILCDLICALLCTAVVTGALSRRLWHFLLLRAGVSPDTKWERIKKEQVRAVAREVVCGRYRVEGRGQYRDEFVTAGGVKLGEVDFESMESKVAPGLFLAGWFPIRSDALPLILNISIYLI